MTHVKTRLTGLERNPWTWSFSGWRFSKLIRRVSNWNLAAVRMHHGYHVLVEESVHAAFRETCFRSLSAHSFPEKIDKTTTKLIKNNVHCQPLFLSRQPSTGELKESDDSYFSAQQCGILCYYRSGTKCVCVCFFLLKKKNCSLVLLSFMSLGLGLLSVSCNQWR